MEISANNTPLFPHWSSLSVALVSIVIVATVGCVSGIDGDASPVWNEADADVTSPDTSTVADAADADGGGDEVPYVDPTCDGPPPIDIDLPERVETATFAYG